MKMKDMKKNNTAHTGCREGFLLSIKSVRLVAALISCLFMLLSSASARAAGQISLTTLGVPYTENFDTLSDASGTTNNILAIPGWYLTETGGGARDNEMYGVDNGTSGTGDTYSYGTTGATDRALGGLLSGTLIPTYGASFTNNTGSTIDRLVISYVGEEWHLGFAGRTDRIDFQYSLDATELFNGSWTDVNALDFTTPDATAPTGAKDGDAAGYRTSISGTISGLSIPNGATFWIRWNDFDAANADDGLAVDDFSLTAYSCQSITVTNNGDNGPGSLRQAIADLCSGGTITFDNDYTITLASELAINKNLTITGAGHNVTVSGNHVTRVFNLTGGTINLNQLTIADGYFVDGSYSGVSGAGIRIDGSTLNLTNSTVSGNVTGWPGGGGIELRSGAANVSNCAFIGNSGNYGGGIDTSSSTTLNVINSTFSGNSAASAGGGLSVAGTGNIINSTISGNSAGWADGGGGLNNEDGAVTVSNSIIANNPTGGNCFNHYPEFSLIVGVNSLADDGSCGAGFTNSASIRLGTLGNYGGSAQTFPLLPGSSAIDAGDDVTCTSVPVSNLDQRGISRPQGAHCDIGAFESQGFVSGSLTGTPQNAVINTAFGTPLGLTVTANNVLEPVNGGAVTFAAPASGASATLVPSSSATISGGIASVSATANGTTGGPYTVTAGASGAASVSFSLTNVAAPDTSITSQPSNPSGSSSASFSFSGIDGIGTLSFECQMDSAGFAACTSGQTYNGLADGSHTFQVRVKDAVGNVDVSPASYTWMTDTTAPDTMITLNPANPSAGTSASFSFTGIDGAGTGIAGFECQMDSAGFSACTSGQTYNGLADGSHTFQVRAKDNVGNTDASPASYTWVIDASAPDTVINSVATLDSTSVSVSFSGNDGAGSGISRFECQVDGGGFSVCTSPKTYTGLGIGPHAFEVRAVDALGNVDPAPALLTCGPSITAANITDSGPGSLRRAIADICPGGTIDFSSGLAGQTVALSSGQLTIDKSMTINGLTASSGVAVSGSNALRVFNVSAGTVTINNLTIRDGLSTGGSGLNISNPGTAVTLNNCAVSNNTLSVSASGAGIINNAGASLTMNNCTVSGNFSTFDGGGILNLGALYINSSTITNNTANGGGGGGTGGGGGLENLAPGVVLLRNTIIAGNIGSPAWGPDCYTPGGALQSNGYNRIGTTNSCSIVPAATDSVNFAFPSLLLGSLQNNGGPTPTHALLPGSPAIDAISGCNSGPVTDQRGITRPQGGACDIGAYEFRNGTTTTVVSSLNPSVYGTSVTFTATVADSEISGSPTGAVTFKDGTIDICTAVTLSAGSAQCTTAALAAGNHTITAVYTSDSSFSGSTSVPVTQTVTLAEQGTLVVNAGSPLTYGMSETLNTTGGSGTGLVTYQVTAGSCTITGVQLNQLTANSGTGTCTVTAIKAADNNYSAVTALPVTVTLQKAVQSLVVNAGSPLTYNTSETLSTTGGSGTGLVTYQVTAGSCTITGAQLNQLTANSGTGSCTVTAAKAADNNYSAVTSAPVIVALQQVLPVISFGSVPSPTFPGPDFTLSATTTNTDSSALSFSVVSGPCSPVSGSTFRPTGAGICVIQAASDATGNFGGASQTLSITITAATAAPAVVPTMNEWGMILFMLLAGVGSIYHLWRSRGV